MIQQPFIRNVFYSFALFHLGCNNTTIIQTERLDRSVFLNKNLVGISRCNMKDKKAVKTGANRKLNMPRYSTNINFFRLLDIEKIIQALHEEAKTQF